mmetsp:Transcript_114415/g.244039  ORF Transcript_114415/g.244039 Transcript_114415/m.244039 type:complete len:330 (-) Transcript_114415:167-1156(-)
MDADKYNFVCEHYEEHSGMTKEFLLTCFAKKGGQPLELSILETKSKKMLLKRGVYNQDGDVHLEDMYKGGMVTVCSRKIKIVDYADNATRELFERGCELVCTRIGSAAFSELGAILSAAADAGFRIKRLKTLAEQGSQPAVALELVGEDAKRWPEVAQGCVSSSTLAAITSLVTFPESKDTTATYDNCSLCIIRPHAVREGQAGTIVSTLLGSGFEISAIMSYSLLKSQVENFYEVYKTVVPSSQFSAMIGELASGVCIAMEVRAPDDVVGKLRELCGPYDVEIARHLRPGTLRAKLGRDNVHNAVHCTDLPEDGVLESQYFFQILPAA